MYSDNQIYMAIASVSLRMKILPRLLSCIDLIAGGTNSTFRSTQSSDLVDCTVFIALFCDSTKFVGTLMMRSHNLARRTQGKSEYLLLPSNLSFYEAHCAGSTYINFSRQSRCYRYAYLYNCCNIHVKAKYSNTL